MKQTRIPLLLKRMFCLCFCFLCVSGIQAQQTDTTKKRMKLFHLADYDGCGHNNLLTLAAHAGRNTSFEISFCRGYSWSSGGYPGSFGQYGIGLETFNLDASPVYAPKLSCELDPFLPPICLSRLNLLYVTDFNGKSSLKYRHEVGLSLLGHVNLTYGYTFAFYNRDFMRTTHSINLQWNIFLGKRRYERE